MLKLFRRKTEPINVYCQNCGRNLTEIGGEVHRGKIFCEEKNSNERSCKDEYLWQLGIVRVGPSNYRNPKQVQMDTREGYLDCFGSLEKVASQ